MNNAQLKQQIIDFLAEKRELESLQEKWKAIVKGIGHQRRALESLGAAIRKTILQDRGDSFQAYFTQIDGELYTFSDSDSADDFWLIIQKAKSIDTQDATTDLET